MNAKNLVTILVIVFASRLMGHDCETSPELLKFESDRPEVGALIARHETLRVWLVSAFNGKLGNRRLLWRNDESILADKSLGKQSYENDGVVITVSPRPSPLDQLTILVYECANARYETDYKAVFRAAVDGALTREEFVVKAMQIEHQACLAVQDVLQEKLSVTEEEASLTKAYRKILSQPKSFETFMRGYSRAKRNDFDATEYYRSIYDSLLANGMPKRKEEAR